MTVGVPHPAVSASLKVMALRRPDTCPCGSVLAAGEQAAWDRSSRTVWCLPCAQAVPTAATTASPGAGAQPTASSPIELGAAGASAQQEFDRRHSKRESRVREAHPKLGGVILACRVIPSPRERGTRPENASSARS